MVHSLGRQSRASPWTTIILSSLVLFVFTFVLVIFLRNLYLFRIFSSVSRSLVSLRLLSIFLRLILLLLALVRLNRTDRWTPVACRNVFQKFCRTQTEKKDIQKAFCTDGSPSAAANLAELTPSYDIVTSIFTHKSLTELRSSLSIPKLYDTLIVCFRLLILHLFDSFCLLYGHWRPKFGWLFTGAVCRQILIMSFSIART